MEANRTRLGLGIALIVVAVLGLAAFGTNLLPGMRGGDVASDPAYVAAMSYAGPKTDVAESTRSAGTEPTRGHTLAVVTHEPDDATARAVAGSSEASTAADRLDTATGGNDASTTDPAPEAGAPTIDDWNRELLEGSAPFDEAKGEMPAVEGGDNTSAVVGWFEPPTVVSTPERVQSDANLLSPPDLGRETHDGNCTFRESFETKDSDGDGKPEYARYRSLLLCIVDENRDGNPEHALATGRDAELWDDDEDGTFNRLDGKQASREIADPNDDGTIEYEARGLWTLLAVDET